MDLTTHPEVQEVFNQYPDHIRPKMDRLRTLVLETAAEIDGLEKLEETLKWGEPSYLTKRGSTLRMDWKEKKPDQYAMYFKCTSKLVNTFELAYGDKFKFETTRAIVFSLDDEIPEKELKHCISLALTYHKVKHLPMLGV
ncbi:MAG: DUF1801 domain-containing protein [Cyclobacteriaceae bacterium]